MRGAALLLVVLTAGCAARFSTDRACYHTGERMGVRLFNPKAWRTRIMPCETRLERRTASGWEYVPAGNTTGKNPLEGQCSPVTQRLPARTTKVWSEHVLPNLPPGEYRFTTPEIRGRAWSERVTAPFRYGDCGR